MSTQKPTNQKSEKQDRPAAEPREESRPAKKEPSGPKPKTGFFMKLIGLGIVALAVWAGFFFFKTGKNPFDPKNTDEALTALEKDLDEAKEKGKEYAEKFMYTLDDLKKRMQGPPPKTEDLLSEAKEEKKRIEREQKEAETVSKSQSKKSPPPSGPYSKAKKLFNEGVLIYDETDPGKPQNVVQPKLRQAARKFEQALDILDRASESGKISEKQYQNLGARVTKYLYDCRKRMELKVR